MKLLILPAFLFALATTAYADSVIYDTLPNPLPPNNVSVGYEADGIGELGGLIQFAGKTPYALTGATIAMSTWALESTYAAEIPATPDRSTVITGATLTQAGFYLPLTLNIYDIGPNDTVGSLITTATIDAFIPWRNAPDPAGCPSGSNSPWLASNGNCYNGQLVTVALNLPGVTVPGQVIYSVAFNTESAGTHPTGASGPYVSLNFGLTQADPTVGSNPFPEYAYADRASIAGESSSYLGYKGEVEFTGDPLPEPAPEPSSQLLFATGLIGLAVAGIRRDRLSGTGAKP